MTGLGLPNIPATEPGILVGVFDVLIHKGMSARSTELKKEGTRAIKTRLVIRSSTPYDRLFLNCDREFLK